MRKLTVVLGTLLLAACKTTDPLSDDIQRSDVINQDVAASCVEDATREDAPEIMERGLSDSFGIGSGVNVKCLDKAVFKFHVAGHPGKVSLKVNVANLDTGEVSVIVNGREVGELAGEGERMVEIPLEALRPNGNTLVLDNVKNPPGDETWLVGNLSIETE